MRKSRTVAQRIEHKNGSNGHKNGNGMMVKESKERLLAVRIPESLMRELDKHVAAMHGEAPWAHMTRSDAVRWLLGIALASERKRLRRSAS